jgi:hypothetical protein
MYLVVISSERKLVRYNSSADYKIRFVPAGATARVRASGAESTQVTGKFPRDVP